MKPIQTIFGALLLAALIGCGGGGGGGNGSGGNGGGAGDSGRLYIVDGSQHRIVRMDNIQGDNWTSFGTLGNGVNQFNLPRGMAFDSQNRIYVADRGNNRIVRMDNFSGAGWTTFGANGSGVGKFIQPNMVAIDKQGHIYVTDSGNHRVVRMDDMNGTNWISYGSSGSGIGQFDEPGALAVDKDNHIYVGDPFNNRIIRFDNMSGLNWTEFKDNGLVGPCDIRIYGQKMLIADRQAGVIMTDLMSATGWKSFFLEKAQSCCMDKNGKIYVVDQGFNLLSQYPSIDGGAPATYGSLGQNEFTSPNCVTFGP